MIYSPRNVVYRFRRRETTLIGATAVALDDRRNPVGDRLASESETVGQRRGVGVVEHKARRVGLRCEPCPSSTSAAELRSVGRPSDCVACIRAQTERG